MEKQSVLLFVPGVKDWLIIVSSLFRRKARKHVSESMILVRLNEMILSIFQSERQSDSSTSSSRERGIVS